MPIWNHFDDIRTEGFLQVCGMLEATKRSLESSVELLAHDLTLFGYYRRRSADWGSHKAGFTKTF